MDSTVSVKSNSRIFPFLTATYLVSWSLWCLARVVDDYGFKVYWLGGELRIPLALVLFIAGGVSPGVVALVLMRRKPLPVGKFLGALMRRKPTLAWCLLGVLIPLSLVLPSVIPSLISGQLSIPSVQVGIHWLVYFLVNLPLSSFWEELGWRGFLLPRLQIHYSPLASAVLVGAVWGPWHLPKQLLFSPLSKGLIELMPLFWIQLLALSIIMTWLFNSSGRSLLPVVLLHGSFNVFDHFVVTPLIAVKGLSIYIGMTVTLAVAAIAITLLSHANLGSVTDSSHAAD